MSIVITPPAVEPVLLEQAIDHLRLSSDAADLAQVSFLVSASRAFMEDHLGRALITQTVEDIFDAWPADEFRLCQPFQSVSQITYIDADGAWQTLSAALYATVPERGIIERAYGASWPEVRCQRGAVRLRTVVGFGASWNDVPRPIRQGILIMTAQMYEHREAVITGTIVSELPMGVRLLVAPYRLVGF
ncbi:MAG: hypothetical protein DCC73_15010 [Proteobacteria bacterium]|nr:MAG: hypothetical protein DCC73_15010 [Pseudomonadota bacterium]